MSLELVFKIATIAKGSLVGRRLKFEFKAGFYAGIPHFNSTDIEFLASKVKVLTTQLAQLPIQSTQVKVEV